MHNFVSIYRNALNIFVIAGLLGCLGILLEGRNDAELVVPSPVEPVYEVETVRKEVVTRYLAAEYRQPPEAVRTYVDLAWHEAKKHRDVEPELLLAVMQKESSLRPTVSSRYGAQGLMQVVPRWHPEKLFARESLYDPTVNVRVGAQILQEYIAAAGGALDVALAKYSGNARGYSEFVVQKTKELKALSLRPAIRSSR